MPRILVVTPGTADYLSDSLLHGLRELLGDDAVDVPRADHMYRDASDAVRSRAYGNGFTLFFRLAESGAARDEIWRRVAEHEFDLVVFGDISRSWGAYAEWGVPLAGEVPVAVIDGADSPAFYPYGPKWWRRPRWWFLPRARKADFKFKREIGPWTYRTSVYGLLPASLASKVGPLRSLRPLAFSIPAENLRAEIPEKTKDFPTHIVDEEVAARLDAATSYAFADEAEYYDDLAASWFGITTKRAGWDCMRHYEIAANGAIPCFRALSEKPASCAPHGLIDGVNCIDYRDADDLFARTSALSEGDRTKLAEGALEWARANTTVERAKQFLATCLPD